MEGKSRFLLGLEPHPPAGARRMGAFAYSLDAVRDEVRFLGREPGRLAIERQQLTLDLKQAANGVAELRAEQDRNRPTVERLRADLVAPRAEVTASKAQQPRAGRSPPQPAPPPSATNPQRSSPR
jgi:predicted  nucleic acid-binding Zn-ribbon protein